MTPPSQPRIYHITHVDNLQAIVANEGLLSDATMVARAGPPSGIGMQTIKQRRLGLPVTCHPGYSVGDFVPFYFCPRSIMLYVLHCANHPDLAYRGGQGPIVHLEAELDKVVAWANREGRRWAFRLSNAGAYYAEFRSSLDALSEIDWSAVNATDFRAASVKEGKQAEFLVHGDLPWGLVSRIGVASLAVAARAQVAIQGAAHQPIIDVHAHDGAAAVRAVHAWGPQKRAFTSRQIELTARHLADAGWIPKSSGAVGTPPEGHP